MRNKIRKYVVVSALSAACLLGGSIASTAAFAQVSDSASQRNSGFPAAFGFDASDYDISSNFSKAPLLDEPSTYLDLDSLLPSGSEGSSILAHAASKTSMHWAILDASGLLCLVVLADPATGFAGASCSTADAFANGGIGLQLADVVEQSAYEIYLVPDSASLSASRIGDLFGSNFVEADPLTPPEDRVVALGARGEFTLQRFEFPVDLSGKLEQ